jgi:hypothetical protein
MNIISSILNRELITPESKLNIIWTGGDNEFFKIFIKKLNHNIVTVENLFFTHNFPQLIICNDRLSSFDKTKQLSIQYHIPVLVVDHIPKNHLISKEQIPLLDNLPCSYKIAINKEIYLSWGSTQNEIINFNISDKNSLEYWDTIIHTIAKRIFLL